MNNTIYVAKSEPVPSVPNVCRLCSAEDEENLIDLFNPQTPVLNFFRSVILYGTGLEIKEDDIVSKMVCQRCCEIAVKLHRYRSNALNNDKLLKAQYGIPQQSPTEASTESPLSLSNGHNKTDDESDLSLQSIINENSNCEKKGVQQEPAKIYKDVVPEPKVPRVIYKHPSVQKIYKLYPNVIVPQKIFSDHVAPVISLDKSEVTDWFESQFEKMKKKLSHITIKKVANDDGTMGKCNGSSHDIFSPTAAVINNDSVLDRRPSTTSTCSKNDTASSNDGTKSVRSKTSDNLKSKKSTARKSTTTIKVNVPQQIRKRNSSSCSDWFMDDHFDDALSTSNLSIHSNESSDQPKKRPSLSSSLPDKKDTSRTSFNSKIDLLDVFTDVKPQEKPKTIKAAENLLEKENNLSSTVTISSAKNLPTEETNFSPNFKVASPNNLPTEKINLLDRLGSPDESSSSQKQTPVIFQRARKRTAARVGSSVTNKMTKSDKTAKKKNKRYFNKDMVTDFKELDCMSRNYTESSLDSDTISTVGVVAGRSTSDQDSLFVLTSGKTLAVFICAVCSLVCDTKRQLVDHEKTHLTCKFCKVRIKNLQLLIEHLNDTCIINVMKDNARVQLLRVDDNPVIVEKYKDAFQADTACDEDTKDEDINHDDMFNNDDYVPDVKEECDEALIKHEELKIEDTNENDTSDIISLSDNEDADGDGGVEYSVIQRHTIVPEEEEEIHIDDELKIINRTDDNDIFLFDAMQRHHASETEMIKTLFKKYYHGLIKFDKRCQTFRNTNRCVRRTSNNLILLERMLSELTVYIVAVSVESRPNITARFNTPQPPATRPLEYWGHKKTTCIVKPIKSKPSPVKSTVAESKSHAKRPPIETKHTLANMSVEEKIIPSQISTTQTKPILTSSIPSSVQIVNPLPSDSSTSSPFQQVFITSSNISSNTIVSSVPISLVPTPTVQLVPSTNVNLISTVSNALVPVSSSITTSIISNLIQPSNPSTSGIQNDTLRTNNITHKSKFVPIAPKPGTNCLNSNSSTTDATNTANTGQKIEEVNL